MRIGSIVATTLGFLSTAVVGSWAQVDDTPTLNVVTTFPNNDFHVVRNGESNRVVFGITNPPGTERILSLESIQGAYLNPAKVDGQRGRVVRNMTTYTLPKSRMIKSVGGGKAFHQVYDFYSEFKPQVFEVEFSLNVRDGQTSRLYRLPVYRGQVQVIEPPTNWFDPQVLFIYLLLIGSVVAVGAYYFHIQQTKKANAAAKAERQQLKKTATSTTPVTSQEGYDQSWIPETHLKQRVQPARKAKK